MNINDLKVNQKGTIQKVEGEGVLRHRLLEMGLVPGTLVKMNKIAPLGDPIQITVRGYELSIRKEDAKLVILEEGEAK